MPGIGDTNRLASLYDHVTAAGLVYPTGAAGATVQSPAPGAANWTPGTIVTIVPAATINSRYHIHSISVESCDQPAITPAVFELALYHGPDDILVSTVRVAISGGFFGNMLYPISSALIGPGERIRAILASSDGFANQMTITISICYCIED